LLVGTIGLLITGLGCQGGGEQDTAVKAAPGTAISSDGVPIRYEAQGHGDSTLVFVHGWACDRTYWKEQIPFFSERYRVVTLDLAGHGESGRERSGWTIPAFGQDVVAVLEALDLKQAVLIGHSMGGSIVVEAARTAPGRVAAVIGVDTYQNVGWSFSDDQIDVFLAPMREHFTLATADFVRQMFLPESDSLLRERVAADMSSAPPEISVACLENFFRYDLKGALSDLDVPIGAVNTAKYPTDLEALRAAVPQFQLEIIDGVGHFLMQENPEEFNQILNALLLRLVRS
jgi:pimeloyl-ACP methyl ester carboxylesterase